MHIKRLQFNFSFHCIYMLIQWDGFVNSFFSLPASGATRRVDPIEDLR